MNHFIKTSFGDIHISEESNCVRISIAPENILERGRIVSIKTSSLEYTSSSILTKASIELTLGLQPSLSKWDNIKRNIKIYYLKLLFKIRNLNK